MRRAQRLPELLAPAGDMQALYAAVAAGADAVYVGGERYGARAFAKNFNGDELINAVKYCHAHGVRLYVTLNTLIFERELDDAVGYARFLNGIGIDALIVADLGVISRIREEIPDLELHASTQMGVHNLDGANEAYRMGCSRVVLARECSATDAERIISSSLAECEMFLHGALCVCHSGQCLFSSLVGGRSGNRGECAQPCRLPYGNGSYPLSLKDLSLAGHIGRLIDSGVSSLKIEGRMKSADYVYRVTSIYRRLLDGHRGATAAEQRELDRIFSRGGFTDGYYTGKSESGMTGVRTDEQKRVSREISGAVFDKARVRVLMRAGITRGKPSEMTLSCALPSRWDGEAEYERLTVSVTGAVPKDAISSPLTSDNVKARLSKLGNTLFTVSADDIKLTLDEGLNISPSELNELRRTAAEALENKLLRPIRREPVRSSLKACRFDVGKSERIFKTALFFNTKAYSELAERGDIIRNFDVRFVPLFKRAELSENAKASANGVYVPPVIMQNELSEVKSELMRARSEGTEYALVGNIGQLEAVRAAGLIPIADVRMNVTNTRTKDVLRALGIENLILSPELTLPMAKDIGGGLTVCGRIPLMITERCFIRENFGCDKCGGASLTDRVGKKFPLLREYKHRNLIFNSVITYMGDKRDELGRCGIRHFHFIFSTEGARETEELIRAFMGARAVSVPFCRVKQKLETRVKKEQ